MTTQERINRLVPYLEENFITCDTEYDYSLSVNVWLNLSLAELEKGYPVLTDLRLEYIYGDNNFSVYALTPDDPEEKVENPATIDDLLDGAWEIIKHYNGENS